MTHWHKYWARDYTYHYMELFLRYINKRWKGFYFLKEYLLVRENNIFTMYATLNEKKKFYNYLLKKYTINHQHLKKLIERFRKKGQQYCAVAAKIHQKNLKKISNEELIRDLKEYYTVWIVYTLYLWTVFNIGEAFCQQASAYITTKAQKLGKNELLSKYLAYLAAPSQRCSVLVLNDTITHLKKQNKKIDLRKLLEEYQWIPWGDLQAHLWTLKDIKEYVDSHAQTVESLIDFEVMKKELKLNEKEIEMVKINKDLAYLRDLRDDFRRRAVFEIHFVYEEVARRCNVDYYDELMYYSTPELYDLLRGKKLSPQELTTRKGDCMVTLVGEKLKATPREKAQHYFNEIKEQEAHLEIKGLAAQPGIIRGTVKIIRLDKELSKIEEGDIMVALTTHPEYITKMQIAKAIVTDEGGITCHAAIVAREMGIPCIVGTKNATQVLKDGDVVEVNAATGVVRKIV